MLVVLLSNARGLRNLAILANLLLIAALIVFLKVDLDFRPGSGVDPGETNDVGKPIFLVLITVLVAFIAYGLVIYVARGRRSALIVIDGIVAGLSALLVLVQLASFASGPDGSLVFLLLVIAIALFAAGARVAIRREERLADATRP